MDMGLDSMFSVNRTPGIGNPVTSPTVDTSVFLNLKSKAGYGFSTGSFFKLATINDKQMVALDV